MTRLFEWDPAKRITAKESLTHPWFHEGPGIGKRFVLFRIKLNSLLFSVFEGSTLSYPTRRVSHEDNGDAKMGS
jgi:cyclin-dependent kinase 8/11